MDFLLCNGPFGITSFNTLGQSVSASENVIVSSSDREITEPKIIEFGEQGGIQARVQVFKFSILFPPGQYPSAVYSTHMYIGHFRTCKLCRRSSIYRTLFNWNLRRSLRI